MRPPRRSLDERAASVEKKIAALPRARTAADAGNQLLAAIRQDAAEHQDFVNTTSMVNYGKAILGAKKFDASAFASMSPPVR